MIGTSPNVSVSDILANQWLAQFIKATVTYGRMKRDEKRMLIFDCHDAHLAHVFLFYFLQKCKDNSILHLGCCFFLFFSAFDIYFICPSMANRFWATSSTSETWRMRYFTGQTSLWGRANFYGCSDPYIQKPLTSELFVNLSKNTVSTQLTVIRVKVGYMAGYDIIYPNSLRFIFATTDYTHYY